MMDGLKKVTDFMNNLQDTAVAFADYTPINPQDVDFHEIEDEKLLKYVKKAGAKDNLVIWVVVLAFALSGVLAFVQRSFFWGALMVIGAGVIASLYIPGLIQPPMIKEGFAAFKQTKRGQRKSSGGYSHTYFVTVAFAEPEKTLCTLIQTNKEDYEKIEECSPVFLVKKGKTFFVCAVPDDMLEQLNQENK